MVLSRRLGNVLMVAVCAGLMGFALYAQHGLQLDPCPLCVFQRIGVMAFGAVVLLAALHDPVGWGRRVYGILGLLTAAAGGAVSARHAYLQSLPPDQVPACGPGLDYMLDSFPFTEVLRKVFSGSGECAEVSWSFLGLSMPWWVLIWFVALGSGGLWWNWRRAAELRLPPGD